MSDPTDLDYRQWPASDDLMQPEALARAMHEAAHEDDDDRNPDLSDFDEGERSYRDG